MRIGLFLFGFLWFLFGVFLNYTDCFINESCDYSSLIAPLPGIVLMILSLKKTRSPDEEKAKKNLSSYYLKWLTFLIALGVLLFVETKFFPERTSVPLAISIFVTALGLTLINRVYVSFKTGKAIMHREGVIGHGFHTYSSNDKFKFWFLQTVHFVAGLCFTALGLFSVFQFVIQIIT